MRAIIIFRDRVTYAKRCATALRAAGLDVAIADQGTTWPAAAAWLDAEETAGTVVLRHGPGTRPRDLWEWEPFREACGTGRYAVTDPDVIPAQDCPADWPARLCGLLDAWPDQTKAGLGLRTDDIPACYARRDLVTEWEAQFWRQPAGDGAYRAEIDTTLALYRPLGEVPGFTTQTALRTGPPYLARHLAWYENPDNLTPELAWYHEHAEPGISFWASAPDEEIRRLSAPPR